VEGGWARSALMGMGMTQGKSVRKAGGPDWWGGLKLAGRGRTVAARRAGVGGGRGPVLRCRMLPFSRFLVKPRHQGLSAMSGLALHRRSNRWVIGGPRARPVSAVKKYSWKTSQQVLKVSHGTEQEPVSPTVQGGRVPGGNSGTGKRLLSSGAEGRFSDLGEVQLFARGGRTRATRSVKRSSR